MGCDFTQCDLSPSGSGSWSGTVTAGGTSFAATLNTSDPVVTNWTLTVNGNTYNAAAGSTATPLSLTFIDVSFPCGLMSVAIVQGSCEAEDGEPGVGGGSPGCTFCPDLPGTLFVTASGWANASCGDCSPFNGDFSCALTASNCTWESGPITACGQTWNWFVVQDGSVWTVRLVGADATVYEWHLILTDCVLPKTLPFNASATTAAGCTAPGSVTVSE